MWRFLVLGLWLLADVAAAMTCLRPKGQPGIPAETIAHVVVTRAANKQRAVDTHVKVLAAVRGVVRGEEFDILGSPFMSRAQKGSQWILFSHAVNGEEGQKVLMWWYCDSRVEGVKQGRVLGYGRDEEGGVPVEDMLESFRQPSDR